MPIFSPKGVKIISLLIGTGVFFYYLNDIVKALTIIAAIIIAIASIKWLIKKFLLKE